MPPATAASLDAGDLSGEHDAMAWIDLEEFGDYETLGQYAALERLGLVGGDEGQEN